MRIQLRLCWALCLAGLAARPALAQNTWLVSRNSAGAVADGAGLPTTGMPVLSADGWFVAFVSFVPDLVPGDTNAFGDVFLRNRHDNTTTLISAGTAGQQGNGLSGLAPEEFEGALGISLTGRFIAFPSGATNLVPDDANGVSDIFLRDTLTGTTSRVSIATGGAEGNGRSVHCAVSPSADGRYVVFDSRASNLVPGDTNARRDIFLRDRVSETTERVSIATGGAQADQDCFNPSVSADGRFVVFTSSAATLAPGGNPGRCVFLRDRTLGQTHRVAVTFDTSGNNFYNRPEATAVSDDGRLVAYVSADPALVGLGLSGRQTFVTDRQTGITTQVSVSTQGTPADGMSDHRTFLSTDGRYVGFVSTASNLAFQSAGCHSFQAYVHDRTLHVTSQASVSPTGAPGQGSVGAECIVSADGTIAVFSSTAGELVPGDTNGRGDVFTRDLAAGTTSRASVSSSGFQGTAYVGPSSAVVDMSSDARYVVLLSSADNLAPCTLIDDAQVYVRDLDTGVTELISTGPDGEAGGVSDAGAISDDGRFVAFTSESSRIVVGDTNNSRDVFRHDRQAHTTTRVSVATGGAQHNGTGFTDAPSISADGRYVAFHSDASNLAGLPDTNGSEDVFVHDTALNTTHILSLTPGGVPGASSSYGPRLSADGQFVAFTSGAGNLVPGDTNQKKDVFLVPRAGGAPARISISSDGAQADGDSSNASISADGRYVAFFSTATNLVEGDTNGSADVFVRDVLLGTTIRASLNSAGVQANGPSIGYPVISRDGLSVAFCSDASNLVADDTNGTTDTFVRSIPIHRTVRVSVGDSGQQGALPGGLEFRASAISGDGRLIAFTSLAGGLVPDDTNNASDAFLRDVGILCPADFNADGFLDPLDYNGFINAFESVDMAADFNSDGFLDPLDYNGFINAFEAGC